METCPNCHRKLVSHTSPRCNWCGHEINDPEYQVQANEHRKEYFAEQAAYDAAALNRYKSEMQSGIGYDPLFGVLGGAMNRNTVREKAAFEARLRELRAEQAAAAQPNVGPTFGRELNTAGQQTNTKQDEPSQPEPKPDRFGHLEL